MKAEHRKELQTNSLADGLGRLVRRLRSGSGFSWFKAALVLIVVLGVLGYMWRKTNIARADAELWAKVEYNDYRSLSELMRDAKDSRQGQAGRFALGFSRLWIGIRDLGRSDANVMDYLKALQEAAEIFTELSEECKDDPARSAEAKYHLAVCIEAFSAYSPMGLDQARGLFEELSKGDLATTAYGVLATKRLEQYNNPGEFRVISDFYHELRKRGGGPMTK